MQLIALSFSIFMSPAAIVVVLLSIWTGRFPNCLRNDLLLHLGGDKYLLAHNFHAYKISLGKWTQLHILDTDMSSQQQ